MRIGPRHYPAYMLALLVVVGGLHISDRLGLALMLQGIKGDLSLSDTQLGLLTGAAYAIFHAAVAMPIARRADCGDRVRIIWISTVLWGAMVALSALAHSFTTLFLCRVAVAVGEAGCLPASYSLIAEQFDRAARPKAMSIFQMSSTVAQLSGLIAAGWINQRYGWRVTFLVIAAPALPLAFAAARSLREPRRARPASPEAPRPRPVCLRELARALATNRTFVHVLIGWLLASVVSYAMHPWQPAYLARAYHLSTGSLGVWLTLVHGVPALAGLYVGGSLASRYLARRERVQLRALAAIWVAFVPLLIGAYLTQHLYICLALLALASFAAASLAGPFFALIQTLVAPDMRATATAALLLLSSLIGQTAGPALAGAVSDHLHALGSTQSLREALILISPLYLWAAAHLWRASATVAADLKEEAPAPQALAAAATVLL